MPHPVGDDAHLCLSSIDRVFARFGERCSHCGMGRGVGVRLLSCSVLALGFPLST